MAIHKVIPAGCGGPGSGVPGPCPEGDDESGDKEGDRGGQGDKGGSKQTITKDSPGEGKLADGKKVTYIPHPNQRADETTVMVSAKELEKAWEKDDMYIPPGGGGKSDVPGRREAFEKFLESGKPVQASRITVDEKGNASFIDGRHRFSVLRDKGADKVAVTVSKKEAGRLTNATALHPTGCKPLTIRNVSEDVVELLLYDVIGSDFFGSGIDARSFREQVKGIKAKTLNLRINSPGGSTTEGAAMLNALDEWKKKGRAIEVDVDGLAASAASVVMMAGDVVRVAANGLVMIHEPYTMAMGGASDMRRTADLLDKVKEQILDSYMRRSKLSRAELSAAMAAETWYSGSEAVEVGLADSVGEQVRVAAFAGMPALLAKMKYKHTPALPSDAAAWAETERRKAIVAAMVG